MEVIVTRFDSESFIIATPVIMKDCKKEYVECVLFLDCLWDCFSHADLYEKLKNMKIGEKKEFDWELTEKRIVPEGKPGEWREALGAAPGFLGDDLPEDVIRRARG